MQIGHHGLLFPESTFMDKSKWSSMFLFLLRNKSAAVEDVTDSRRFLDRVTGRNWKTNQLRIVKY
jgi:hypothetical protein